MGIKSFFKKIGKGLKKAGRWIRDRALPAVGRFLKPVLSVVGLLPGKIGTIGKVGQAIAGAASNVIGQIPNEDTKRKLQGVVDDVNNKFQQGIDKGKEIARTANNVIGAAKEGVGNVAAVIKPAVPQLKVKPLM